MRTWPGTRASSPACSSGMVQTAGAFCTNWLRRNTPRAALLAPLAGLALAYLCLGFIFGVFQQAAIALAAHADLVYPLWLASQTSLSFAPRPAGYRRRRGAGGGAAVDAHLHRPYACSAGGETCICLMQ